MYEWKNEVPISKKLDDAVAKGMVEVCRMHHRRIMRRTAGTAAGIAVFCAAFFVWGLCNPVLASQIPVIGGIFARVQENVTYSGDYDEKVQMLNVDTETEETEGKYVYAANGQGYTITAKEVYCDGESLFLGLTVTKEGGFGKISKVPTSDYSEKYAQVLYLYGISIQPEEGEEVFFGSQTPVLEGVQTTEDTFEGMVRLSLADMGVKLPENSDIRVNLNWFLYMDEENGGKQDETGEWSLFLPVSVDASEVRKYEINDSVDGFGIGTVTVTPYEIRVESILPPLYETKAELIAAKRAWLKEIYDPETEGDNVEELTDEEVDEQVELARFGDYGIAVFDQNGARVYMDAASEDEKGMVYTYPRQEQEIAELHIYVGEGDTDYIKAETESAVAEGALYHVDIRLE